MSVELTTLPSGLRIVTDAMPHLETASLGVWIGAGSRHEAPLEHGLSHLLEHMAFKGTRRRSARVIAEEIEGAGGDLNAATSVEQTAYHARVLASDTALAVDILADIITDSVFDPAELEREKSVILQEIGAVEDTPDDLVFEMFTATAYPDQPIGRPILGTPARVKGFDRASITAYLNGHYRTGATVITGAGAVEHARLVEDVQQRFSALPTDLHPAASEARYVGGEARLKRRLEQAHIVVGFEGVSFHHPDYYAAQVFANAVGGGMSSRLFQEVREVRGLAYAIYSFHWSYSDTGMFGFYAGTSARDVAELMPVALDCVGAAVESLSADEAERAKAQMKVSLLVALESSQARAEQIARQLLALGRTLSLDEIVSRIDALTVEEIRRAGAGLLRSAPTVASIGPVRRVLAPDAVAARLRGL
ncbi:MAG: insulinase family protein [Methylobacteriaceae bacterium]|nr:insulinase family protein [Methylobacteriaceae bacterium]MBV9247016.1 insulinase family protein [Methylobacteriaceae bacterium]MBV9637499.1 insulinase family protein [Methylobacteriaceae bacterium]MBV9703880.1 insulinase family protein [Methylobacteriaceae bacterium]